MRLRMLLPTLLPLLLIAAAETRAEGVRIGGRVTATGGSPIAQAEVRLLPLLDPSTEARAALERASREPAARALTGDDGRFRLTAPHAGLWTVRVDAPGFAPLEAELLPLIEPVELPDAELAVDVGFTVKTVNGDGTPAPDTLVLLRTDRGRARLFERSRWSIPLRSGTTTEDGTVLLPRGEDETVAASAYAPGRGHREARGLLGTGTTLRLPGGLAVKIEVRSAEGGPIGGVAALAGERPHPVGITDDSGRLEIHVDRGHPLPLKLLALDGGRLDTKLAVPAKPSADEPVRFELPERVSVSGKLIDADSRRPVGGGLVWDRESPIDAVVTDGSGRFVLGGPAGRRLGLTAGAPGYLDADPFRFQLTSGQRDAPTLVLRPAAAIEGTILDDDGRPVRGAEVEVEVRRRQGGMRIEIGPPVELPRYLTGTRGDFRLSPLDPDESYTVKVRAGGFAPARRDVSELEPYRTRSGLSITLTRGQTVTGRLVDTSGQSIRDGAVELRPNRSRGAMGMVRMMDTGDDTAFAGASDGDGRFEVGGLPAGTFDLEARRTGFAKRTVSAIELEPGGDALDLGPIELEPGERVQGRVADRDGAPIEGAGVFLRESGPTMMVMMDGPGEQQEPDSLTDPSGWFVLEDLAPGEKYSLGVERAGYVQGGFGPFSVPRPEPLEIELDAASRVEGSVVDSEQQPVAGAEVGLSRTRTIEMGGAVLKAMMLETETCDAEGRFVFEDQEPGRISLTASAGGYQEAKLDGVEIPKGEDLSGVELTLPAGGVIVGKIRAPDGRPVIGARVAPVAEGRDLLGMVGGAPSDGSGRYRLEGLAPGKISVEATHSDYPRTVRDVEVKTGINELDLEFEGGVEVTGRVIDTAGEPVIDASVRLTPAGRMYGGPEARTLAGGSFEMPGVQDGEYRLWVDAEGYASHEGEQPVTVAGEPVHGLEVRLDRGGAIVGRILGLEPARYSDVIVRAEGSSFLGLNTSAVDYQGGYRLENLRSGTYNVAATLADSGRQANGEATLEPGAAETRLDLEFGGGLTLAGRAVQADAPIRGATVYAEGIDIDHTGWNETDERGAFTIDGLEAGRYQVHLRNWQTGLAHTETVDLATSREIVLEVPTARVAGTVVDGADRRPLPGVLLSLHSEDSTSRGRLPMHNATSDLEGKFEFTSVGNGGWRLAAEKKGYAAVSRNVNVQFERPVDDLALSMDATEGLTLEVRLPAGNPPTEVRLAVLDPAGGSLIGGNYATGESGRVRLSTVPPGSWEVVVSAGGAATANVRAQAPGATVPVRLRPASRLELSVPALEGSGTVAIVRIRDAAGRAFRSLSWNGSPQSEWRMSGGRMEFVSLPPGSWSVTVTAGNGESWRGEVLTTAGGTTELLLE